MRRWSKDPEDMSSMEDGELSFRIYELEAGDYVRWRLHDGTYIEIRAPHYPGEDDIEIRRSEGGILVRPVVANSAQILPDRGD